MTRYDPSSLVGTAREKRIMSGFMEKVPYDSRDVYLSCIMADAPEKGVVVECGVASGNSLRHIARYFRDDRVYGFDTFEGLPENWVRRPGHVVRRGCYKQHSVPQFMEKNVTIIKGLFADTMPGWVEETDEPIKFLHIDCDIYTSSIMVLSCLAYKLANGAVIAFDELCDWSGDRSYANWPNHEWRALREWLEAYRYGVEPVARCNDCQGAIKVWVA